MISGWMLAPALLFLIGILGALLRRWGVAQYWEAEAADRAATEDHLAWIQEMKDMDL